MTNRSDANTLESTIYTLFGRLEAKIDMLMAELSVIEEKVSSVNTLGTIKHEPVLAKLTTKQHAALQMLLGGCSNAEIAERFGTDSINTAKVYVRGLMAHYNVHTRTQVVLIAQREMDDVDDDDYLVMSGGLPKNWHSNFKRPDQYAALYQIDR